MRGPSPSRTRADRSLRMAGIPSPRTLQFLARVSPLNSKEFPLPAYAPAPSSPASSVSSSFSASWRRSRRKSGTSSPTWTPERDITALATSFNPLESIRVLRRRRWMLLDANYALLAALLVFSLWVAPSAPLVKPLALAGLAVLLLVPATGQFFVPSLAIWTYLIYFFCSRFIPIAWRPPISVKVLPALENAIFGSSISHFLSVHTHPILDIIAWLPYGVGHFAMPAVCSFGFFIFSAPGMMPAYARAFGWMSILGVTLAIVCPTTPPWYEVLHGLEPAHYGMGGSAAGLARIDALFHLDMYTTSFGTNPLPFGAFPSLHGGNALLQALFAQHAFPRLRWFAFAYVAWIWWATMYLGHHYAVDLLGGAFIAVMFYVVTYRFWLPRIQKGKLTRWDYEYVELGSRRVVDDIESRPSLIGLKELQRQRVSSEESAWTAGGSSTSSYSRSPSSSSSGTRSPSLSEEDYQCNNDETIDA